jgi:hypothetical protein
MHYPRVAKKRIIPWNTKGGSITVPLTSCLTGLDWSLLKIKTKIVSCHTADSKPVKRGPGKSTSLVSTFRNRLSAAMLL